MQVVLVRDTLRFAGLAGDTPHDYGAPLPESVLCGPRIPPAAVGQPVVSARWGRSIGLRFLPLMSYSFERASRLVGQLESQGRVASGDLGHVGSFQTAADTRRSFSIPPRLAPRAVTHDVS